MDLEIAGIGSLQQTTLMQSAVEGAEQRNRAALHLSSDFVAIPAIPRGFRRFRKELLNRSPHNLTAVGVPGLYNPKLNPLFLVVSQTKKKRASALARKLPSDFEKVL
jgi:hypothetical protein